MSDLDVVCNKLCYERKCTPLFSFTEILNTIDLSALQYLMSEIITNKQSHNTKYIHSNFMKLQSIWSNITQIPMCHLVSTEGHFRPKLYPDL